MKGPGIKDYLQKIEELKQKAMEEGKVSLQVNSKRLHALVSPMHATMPTCCQAMYKQMLEGDRILQRPKGTTGFGSHLTVEFQLMDLDTRERMFPDKKRGRPAKTEEEKLLARKNRLKHNTEDLCNLIEAWLQEHGWQFEEDKEVIKATQQEATWVIHVQGIKRGRKQPLPVQLTEALKQMESTDIHYSLAFNDSNVYRRQWEEIPNAVKNSLNMSVILADKSGNIVEI